MKSYFEDLAWYDYLLCFVYNGIFSYILFKIGEVFLNLHNKSLWLLIGAFQVYFFVTMADSFLGFLPLQPESSWYASMVSSGQYPENAQVNLLVLYYLSLFFSIVCLNTPIIYIFLCALFYGIGIMLCIKAWKTFQPEFTAQQEWWASLLLLIWPAPLLFMTAPLQQAFVILGFGIFFNGWVNYIRNRNWKSLLIGSVIMIALQFESIYWVIPLLCGTLILHQPIALWKRISFIVLVVAALIFAFGQFLMDSPLTPAAFAEMRNTSITEADIYGYGNVYWQSYGEMIKDYPFIVLQFILAPLPIFMQFDLASAPIATLDGIFTAILLIVSVIVLLRKRAFFMPISLMLLFFIIYMGGAADHWMHAIRDRMPITIIFILLVSTLIPAKTAQAK